MTPEDIQALIAFARLTPEQIEKRKRARWIAELRRREDVLAYETQEDSTEDRDGVYR